MKGKLIKALLRHASALLLLVLASVTAGQQALQTKPEIASISHAEAASVATVTSGVGGSNSIDPTIKTPDTNSASVNEFWPKLLTTWLLPLSATIVALVLGYFYGRRPRDKSPDTQAASVAVPTTERNSPKHPAEALTREEPVQTRETPFRIQLSDPAVPDDLAVQLAHGEVVAILGSGLSAQSGLPTWHALINELVDELESSQLLEPAQIVPIKTVLGTGQTQYATEALNQAMRNDYHMAAAALGDIYFKYKAHPSKAHAQLARLPFSACLSGNFDTLLEEAFKQQGSDRRIRVFAPEQSEQALDALSRDEPFIFKLYGSITDDGPLDLGVQQYVDRVRGNAAFEELLDKIFLTRRLLFVGTSLTGIENFMRGIELRSTVSWHHYALVAVDDPSWEIKSSVIRDRFGIEVIPTSSGGEYNGLTTFLDKLEFKARSLRTEQVEDVSGTRRIGRRQEPLSSLTIKNIGPFDELSVELNRNWNLLLGDNGVGKSTILKAVGIALCGEDSAPFADRILKRGRTRGEIILTAGERSYSTVISARSRGGVEVESVGGRVLDQQDWLALGFPALRTITWERPRSEGSLGSRRPTVADILPILNNNPDPRLDGLKQRIVTLDHLRKTEQLERSDSRGYTRLLDEFFEIFDDITEGMQVRFSTIDPQTREITIKTEDGFVPFEALSQGTISLISWVGVLLQRLYEVTPEDQNPRERFVIVLIDEIDAHMHPIWQKTIVHSLSKVFPNAQFIATTHSPLIVAGRPIEQVIRLERDENGKVQRLDVPADMTMGRTDQILAGSLFDLETTRDIETQELTKRYHALLAKQEKAPEDESSIIKLREMLTSRIPPSPTELPERRSLELFNTMLESQVGDAHPEMREVLLKQAKELLESVARQQRT